MTARVTELWRHPVKSCGRERLDAVALEAGKCMPWDRVWAVTHDRSKWDPDNPAWMACANFIRGAKLPLLMAIEVTVDELSGRLTFTHPAQAPITIDPETDGAALVDWLAPLAGDSGLKPARLVRAPGRGMTDTPEPSISLNNHSSLRALGDKVGQTLSPDRFRGNIWFEGLGPWQEFEWLGRDLKLGDAVLRVEHRITRCRATTANPDTGVRDADTLGALRDGWGHQDFGVYASVVQGGRVAVGDTPELI